MDNNKKIMCTRTGCRKEYLESENTETSCRFHDGKPIFHDLKKGWTCCNIIVYDWEEFTNLVGCKVGAHTTQPNNNTEFFKSQTISNAQKGIENISNNTINEKPKDIGEYERKQKEIEEEKKKLQAEKPKEIIVKYII